jgi:hypothetical protein
MIGQAFNPYLPNYEYIPDGEPYVFNGRVYVYGSHDRFNGVIFCMNDYVCWSASFDNLSNWRYEGVIYKKSQDPLNKSGLRLLFAPDVVRGMDGRYYLYYAIDFLGVMSVAVCDSPAGKYEFLGHIHFSNGRLWGRKSGDPFPFDPGVLVDDDGRVYLYSGFYTQVPSIITKLHKLDFQGGYVIELEKDMVTIKKEPKLLFPKEGKGSFVNHEFFEASSIRKINNKYYFVYSSRHNHELCYAVSDHPTSGFQYGGTIISNGDIFLHGSTQEQPAKYYIGNNHGGMVQINDQWYIFYHRHTNRHSYSRQGCAEPITIEADGSIKQVEMTSCGLNGGQLVGVGRYETYIACNLTYLGTTGRYDSKFPSFKYLKHPYITQKGKDRDFNPNQYIANFRSGATAGFKYFHMENVKSISIEVVGKAKGSMIVSTDFKGKHMVAEINVAINGSNTCKAICKMPKGKQALYFTYKGKGKFDFLAFELFDNI